MTAPRTQREHPKLPTPDRGGRHHDGGPAILIVGSCRGGAFVPSEVLICADTLSDEERMHSWLAGHEIHVTLPHGLTAEATRPGLG
jgi:hypothetical protein